MHRRENHIQWEMSYSLRDGRSLYQEIAVYPVHLSPAVQEAAKDILAGHTAFTWLEPLDVLDFHNFSRSLFIMTDSEVFRRGARQTCPCSSWHDGTSRRCSRAGTLKLVGTNPYVSKIAMAALLTDETLIDNKTLWRWKSLWTNVQSIQQYSGQQLLHLNSKGDKIR